MNPARLIALASARGTHYKSAGRATGERLSPSDAAAMCSGVPPLPWACARLKWSGDHTGIRLIHSELTRFANEIRERDQWRTREGVNLDERVDRMVMLVLLETATPSRFKTDLSRAEYLQLKKSAFFDTWRKRYTAIFQRFEQLCTDALRHIAIQNAEF